MLAVTSTSVRYVYQLALRRFSAGKFTVLTFDYFGKLLRGTGKITCQTFKPLTQNFKQNTHFQN